MNTTIAATATAQGRGAIAVIRVSGPKSLELYSVLTGKNNEDTAMATTVGLPLAIAAESYLKGELTLTGLHIPTIPALYQPILSKLKEEGIEFYEETVGSHS